jgi:hypothetical protein
MTNLVYIPVGQFDFGGFYELNESLVSQYVSLRVRAVHSHIAFRRVFGGVNCDGEMSNRIAALEASDMYNDMLDARLKELPVNELLDAKKALHSFMEIAGNPNARDRDRIQALKEAAVLSGITVIDDAGRSRVGGTLADFYAAVDALRESEGANPNASQMH